MINEKEKRTSEFLYLTIEFPTIFIDNVQVNLYFDTHLLTIQMCY